MEKNDGVKNKMTAAFRAKLRSIAAGQPAIMQVGKDGVGENSVSTLDSALTSRELVKISVLKNCPTDVRETAEALAAATGAEIVTVIGRKAVFYRDSDEHRILQLI